MYNTIYVRLREDKARFNYPSQMHVFTSHRRELRHGSDLGETTASQGERVPTTARTPPRTWQGDVQDVGLENTPPLDHLNII